MKGTIHSRKQIGKPKSEKRQRRVRKWSRDVYRQRYMFTTAISESIYSKLPIKTPDSMRLHVQKQITHCSEMNDQIFNIDMNI
jgi:hypothetical protein